MPDVTAANELPACDLPVPTGPAPDNAQWQRGRATWLYDAIRRGTINNFGREPNSPVVVHRLGEIPLTDGRLCACDPYVHPGGPKTFTTWVPPGVHGVYAAVAEAEPGDHLVVAALLVFGAGPVVQWGPDPSDVLDPGVGVGNFDGYDVESGTGCFASPSALATLDRVLTADQGRRGDPVSLAFTSSPTHGAVAVPEAGAEPVAVFGAGWGAGLFATWFGLAADGTPVVALTDFSAFGEPGLDAGSPDVADLEPVAVPEAAPPARGLFGRLFGR